MFRSFRAIARQSNLIAKRTYAEVAGDSLKLSFVLPHQSLYSETPVVQVNIPSINGDLGILANHIPIVEQLRPGLLEVIESTGNSKQYFVSGGFATVQPGSRLSITVTEAFEPSAFSPEAIREQLAEANKKLSSTDEAVAAEAAIELEVLEALQHVAK